MRVINVVEIIENSVLGITSFGVFEEQLSQDVVEQAEKHYISCCRENGATEEEHTDEDLIDMETYENGSYSVCIHWSDI